MMIEKYDNKDAWYALEKYYHGNLGELLDLINLHRDINKRKEKFSQMVIKQIPIYTTHFRFKDQSIGMRIMNYHFKINHSLEREEKIYQQIKDDDPIILNYLNIIDNQQIKEKIEEYYTIYCC